MFRGWPLTEELTAELWAMAEAAPTPTPEGRRQMLVGTWSARVLDDGRVAAAVLFTYENETPFAEATKALFFVEKDGRWLFDEWTESVLVPGRELSVQIEHAVAPPPGISVERWLRSATTKTDLPIGRSGVMPALRRRMRLVRPPLSRAIVH